MPGDEEEGDVWTLTLKPKRPNAKKIMAANTMTTMIHGNQRLRLPDRIGVAYGSGSGLSICRIIPAGTAVEITLVTLITPLAPPVRPEGSRDQHAVGGGVRQAISLHWIECEIKVKAATLLHLPFDPALAVSDFERDREPASVGRIGLARVDSQLLL